MRVPFPAQACYFFEEGACLHDEAGSGSGADAQCVQLLHCVGLWDAFQDRAEALCLSENSAVRLWQERLRAALAEQGECPRCPSAPSAWGRKHIEQGGWPACPHLRNGLCLLALPRCAGRCERYYSGTR